MERVAFFINIYKTKTGGYKVWLLFQITQHERDIDLMKRIAKFLDSGSVNKRGKSYEVVDYKIYKFENIITKIIPLFKANPLKSSKSADFDYFCKASEVIKNKKAKNEVKKKLMQF